MECADANFTIGFQFKKWFKKKIGSFLNLNLNLMRGTVVKTFEGRLQCDQMAQLFVRYFAFYNKENSPISIIK